MSAFTGDLQLSAAGVDQGHLAFQEFLLAGERHVVAGLARPGAEASFARVFSQLPDSSATTLTGYFRRQSQLDLSQRVGLLGPMVKLNISDALSRGIPRRISPPSPSIRSELDSMGTRKFDGRSASFRTITGLVSDLIVDAGMTKVKTKPPGKFAVRIVDLLLDEIAVENSQDDSFFKNDTDEVTLGVTMLSDVGVVTTANHNLGSISEGKTKTLPTPLTIGSIPVSIGVKGFPRSFYFKVDAVDRDDGGYNDLLDAGADYIQDKVTEELIATGIITAGGAIGIPIPPAIANYIASYLKTWFDDFIDWIGGLLKDEDDLLGSRTRTVELSSFDFEISDRTSAGIRTVTSARGPVQGAPFTWTFSGGDGRWRTKMRVQLR